MVNLQVFGMAIGLGQEEFAKDSVVTCTANITQISGQKNIYLDVDSNLIIDEEPIVYSVTDKNDLQKVCSMVKDDSSNKYNCSIDVSEFTNKEYGNIMILYSVKLKSGEVSHYKNEIRISGLSAGNGIVDLRALERLHDLF